MAGPQPYLWTPSKGQDGPVVRILGSGDCQTRHYPRHGAASVLSSTSSPVAAPPRLVFHLTVGAEAHGLTGVGCKEAVCTWKDSIKESSSFMCGCFSDCHLSDVLCPPFHCHPPSSGPLPLSSAQR